MNSIKVFIMAITAMLIVFMSLSDVVSASGNKKVDIDTEGLNKESANFFNEIEKYLFEDQEGNVKFDDSKVTTDTPDEIVETGKMINAVDNEKKEEISSRGIWGIIVTVGGKKLTHYGNYCGKGNNGKKPIDNLDTACKGHDKCYKGFGKGNKKCNTQFRTKLKPIINATKATSHKGAYARAAYAIFK